jgi:hypothetical protein
MIEALRFKAMKTSGRSCAARPKTASGTLLDGEDSSSSLQFYLASIMADDVAAAYDGEAGHLPSWCPHSLEVSGQRGTLKCA